jgi:hypothetical protein
MTEAVYIIYTREFINSNKNVYKIGRTSQTFTKRFNSYPKGSILKIQKQVNDSKNIEKTIKQIFEQKFKLRTDIGQEYFEGNYKDMELEFMRITNDEDENELDDTDKKELADKDENELDDTDKKELADKDENELDDTDKSKQICNYEDFLKFSRVFKIIITNRKTREGFLKFRNSNWRKLSNINSNNFDIDNMETLEGFVENEQNNDYYGKINILTKEIISNNDYRELDDETKESCNNFIKIEYDFKSIILDIICKCYIEKPNYYELKYNEYKFNVSHNNKTLFGKNSLCTVIYDSAINSFVNIDDYDKYGIMKNIKSMSSLTYLPIVKDTNIVTKILNSLLKNKDKLVEYKIMFYSVFVKRTESVNIFYDYHENNYRGLLTTWFIDSWYRLTGTNALDSDSYYENKTFYNKEIRNKKHRFIVIYQNKNYTIENMIKNFISRGITNIIVALKSHQKSNYDIDNYMEYINNNKEMILLNIDKRCGDRNLYSMNIESDEIFSSQLGMPMNFVAWGCSK